MGMNNGLSWFRRQGAPVTVILIASLIVAALTFWLTALSGLRYLILFPGWQSQPWSLVTYPWAGVPFESGLSLICFVFLCMWMWMTGSSLERDLGSAKYALLWLVMILTPALFIVLLGPLTGKAWGAAGIWVPEAAITIIWCVRNQTQTIMLYGIIPLSGKWLGWVTAGTLMVLTGAGNPVFGVIASLHLLLAVAFAMNRIPFWAYSRGSSAFGKARLNDNAHLKKTEKMDKSYYDDVKKREKDREEREKLRKLFESSIDDKDAGNDR